MKQQALFLSIDDSNNDGGNVWHKNYSSTGILNLDGLSFGTWKGPYTVSCIMVPLLPYKEQLKATIVASSPSGQFDEFQTVFVKTDEIYFPPNTNRAP